MRGIGVGSCVPAAHNGVLDVVLRCKAKSGSGSHSASCQLGCPEGLPPGDSATPREGLCPGKCPGYPTCLICSGLCQLLPQEHEVIFSLVMTEPRLDSEQFISSWTVFWFLFLLLFFTAILRTAQRRILRASAIAQQVKLLSAALAFHMDAS